MVMRLLLVSDLDPLASLETSDANRGPLTVPSVRGIRMSLDLFETIELALWPGVYAVRRHIVNRFGTNPVS